MNRTLITGSLGLLLLACALPAAFAAETFERFSRALDGDQAAIAEVEERAESSGSHAHLMGIIHREARRTDEAVRWFESRMLIDKDGRVADTLILQSVGDDAFGRAAVRAIMTWEFEPDYDLPRSASYFIAFLPTKR